MSNANRLIGQSAYKWCRIIWIYELPRLHYNRTRQARRQALCARFAHYGVRSFGPSGFGNDGGRNFRRFSRFDAGRFESLHRLRRWPWTAIDDCSRRVKLLFDENLSHKLTTRLADIFLVLIANFLFQMSPLPYAPKQFKLHKHFSFSLSLYKATVWKHFWIISKFQGIIWKSFQTIISSALLICVLEL